MELQNSEFIIDFKTVQVIQTTLSVAMEKMAFQNCLNRIIEDKYDVQVLGNDRHLGIQKKKWEKSIGKFHINKTCGTMTNLFFKN